MNESNIFGVSIRALIAFMLVLTVCIMSGLKISVVEPLYTLCVVAVSFYLGKSSNQNGGSNGKEISTKPDISGSSPANIG